MVGGAVDPAQGKRKREALGELTSKVTNNRAKAGDAKGKAKDDVPAKPAKTGTTSERVPLRPVASRTRAKAADKKKPEPKDEDAMAVDPPTLPPVPVVLVPAPPLVTQTTIRTSHVSTTTIASRRITSHRTLNTRVSASEDDFSEEPAQKKRRTSSEVGEDAVLEVIEEEQALDIISGAVDEDGELDVEWEDLDKDDHDDPMMVSEYVVDIFNYLKAVEVSFRSTFVLEISTLFSDSKQPCLTPTTWKIRRSLLGRCEASLWIGSSSSIRVSVYHQRRYSSASISLTVSYRRASSP